MLPNIDTYDTAASAARGSYRDNGSRFLAFAYPIGSEDDVKPLVDALRKEYHDARHHCFAYRLAECGPSPSGEGPVVRPGKFRCNDDGEPSGSAGRQILGQIDSAGLLDVLVVVVRYFGGIKLGIPGLIRAYRESSAEALKNAGVAAKTASRSWSLDFDYALMPSVMGVLKACGASVLSTEYAQSCNMKVSVRLGEEKVFLEHIEKMSIFINNL